jgi:hypothetical protein
MGRSLPEGVGENMDIDKVLKESKKWLGQGDKDLRCADLRCADLRGDDLRGADLSGADLRRADLRGANLSGSKGLLVPSKWMADNFEQSEDGYIVYKAFGNTICDQPWQPKEGLVITEVVNRMPTNTCGCGVNFGTLEWIEKYLPARETIPVRETWKCLIRWEWMPDVVVPYNTDGKARCGKMELIEKVS